VEEDDSLVALTFDPETFRPIRPVPVGQESKVLEAFEAIEFSRSYTGVLSTTLYRDAISLHVVVDRISS
jgi:hypothetical protein